MAKDSSVSSQEMSFWDHLDVLRGVMFRGIAVLFLAAVVLFVFMPWIFDNVILAPCGREIDRLARSIPAFADAATSADFRVELINIQLASQFFIHMSASCWLALVLTFPVLIYLIWGFIKPGLYENERRGSKLAFFFGNLMFFLGVAVGNSMASRAHGAAYPRIFQPLPAPCYCGTADSCCNNHSYRRSVHAFCRIYPDLHAVGVQCVACSG